MKKLTDKQKIALLKHENKELNTNVIAWRDKAHEQENTIETLENEVAKAREKERADEQFHRERTTSLLEAVAFYKGQNVLLKRLTRLNPEGQEVHDYPDTWNGDPLSYGARRF